MLRHVRRRLEDGARARPCVARHPVAEGALRALSLAPGIVPLGMIFGAAAVAVGITPAAATVMSAVVFAGGAQFAAVGLAATGASVLEVTGLVLVINSRYFLLSAAALDLARKAKGGRLGRVAVALGVVDESFALQAAWARTQALSVAGMLAVSATFWAMWTASTLLGAVAGSLVPDLRPFGLDYALPGIFVGLLGIFADTRPRLYAGLGALAVAGALALAGWGTAAVLVVPPLFAFALGRWVR